MNLTSSSLALSLLLGVVGLGTPATAQEQVQTEAREHITVLPDELEWNPVGSLPPGASAAVIEGNLSEREPFTLRLRFPANYEIPAHTHATTERVTVLSGTLHLATGDELTRSNAVALPPGSVRIMPPGTRMWGYTGGEEVVIQLNGIGPWGMDPLH